MALKSYEFAMIHFFQYVCQMCHFSVNGIYYLIWKNTKNVGSLYVWHKKNYIYISEPNKITSVSKTINLTPNISQSRIEIFHFSIILSTS